MMAKVEVGAARRRRLPLLARIAAGLVISLLIVAVVGTAASMAWLKHAMREQLPVLDGATAASRALCPSIGAA